VSSGLDTDSFYPTFAVATWRWRHRYSNRNKLRSNRRTNCQIVRCSRSARGASSSVKRARALGLFTECGVVSGTCGNNDPVNKWGGTTSAISQWTSPDCPKRRLLVAFQPILSVAVSDSRLRNVCQ
jgi:hypothetical protein